MAAGAAAVLSACRRSETADSQDPDLIVIGLLFLRRPGPSERAGDPGFRALFSQSGSSERRRPLGPGACPDSGVRRDPDAQVA